MQDVPLPEQEAIPGALQSSSNSTPESKPKTSTLKRILKLGKKSVVNADSGTEAADNTDVAETEDEETDAKTTDPTKRKTIVNFLTRLKGVTKHDTEDQSGSGSQSESVVVDGGKTVPVPNIKPTVKNSLSTYWRNIFKRHQAIGQNAASAVNKSENVQGMDARPTTTTAQQQQQENPDASSSDKMVPEILEDVQVLVMSEEIEATTTTSTPSIPQRGEI